MKAEPELQEIWKTYVYGNYLGLHKLRDFRKEFKEASLIFWQLKAKIDAYKQQIIEMADCISSLQGLLDELLEQNKLEAKVNE